MINGGPDEKNVQYTNIDEQLLGLCAEGPIVAYKKDYDKNTGTFSGWRYRIWATPNAGGPNSDGEYATNPDPSCALLYGSDGLMGFSNKSESTPIIPRINSYINGM